MISLKVVYDYYMIYSIIFTVTNIIIEFSELVKDVEIRSRLKSKKLF